MRKKTTYIIVFTDSHRSIYFYKKEWSKQRVKKYVEKYYPDRYYSIGTENQYKAFGININNTMMYEL